MAIPPASRFRRFDVSQTSTPPSSENAPQSLRQRTEHPYARLLVNMLALLLPKSRRRATRAANRTTPIVAEGTDIAERTTAEVAVARQRQLQR